MARDWTEISDQGSITVIDLEEKETAKHNHQSGTWDPCPGLYIGTYWSCNFVQPWVHACICQCQHMMSCPWWCSAVWGRAHFEVKKKGEQPNRALLHLCFFFKLQDQYRKSQVSYSSSICLVLSSFTHSICFAMAQQRFWTFYSGIVC